LISTGIWFWAEYSTFIVDGEDNFYKLTADDYSGDAGDALKRHSTMKFTTYDRDNDVQPTKNCAVDRGGGFWWRECGATHITASENGIKDFSWKKLPDNEFLQTSRGWIMCP